MYEATGAANTAFERQTNTLAYDIQMVKNLGRQFLDAAGHQHSAVCAGVRGGGPAVVSEALEKIGSYMTGTIIPAAETAVKDFGTPHPDPGAGGGYCHRCGGLQGV